MGWWQRTKEGPTIARLAMPADRAILADLLMYAARRFGTLAVEEQVALLSSGASSLAFAGERAVGFLGVHPRLPADQERWADISLVSVAATGPAGPLLSILLGAALPALRIQAVDGLVCLTEKGWLASALLEAGFSATDQVITYLRNGSQARPSAPEAAVLRRATPAEAETVLRLNAAAFAPLWRYDPATLLSWLFTADHAMLAERDGQPVGFALTTRSLVQGYAQLIRIGIVPGQQGQGIGRQLVADAVAFAQAVGAPGVTLNTQATNAVSRHLYEALGFQQFGVPITVMTRKSAPESAEGAGEGPGR